MEETGMEEVLSDWTDPEAGEGVLDWEEADSELDAQEDCDEVEDVAAVDETHEADALGGDMGVCGRLEGASGRAEVADEPTPARTGKGGMSQNEDEGVFQVRPAGSTLFTADPGVGPPRATGGNWRVVRAMAEGERTDARQIIVAADAWSFTAKRVGGPRQYQVSKRFRVFRDMRTFYTTYLAQSAHRNFFELVEPAAPVKLYLDMEWMSSGPEDGRLEEALHLVAEAIEAWWPALDMHDKQEVYVLKGGRWKDGGYKNSYHVVYPGMVFESNTGAMRRFAQHLASQECFQVRRPDGKRTSMIDPVPYARWQPYRLPLCWKLDDKTSTELTLIGHQCTLGNLLRATATHVPVGKAPNVLDDKSDLAPGSGWGTGGILRALQLDGGQPSSASLQTGTVSVTFAGRWRCPADGRGKCHADGSLLLEAKLSGVEARCSHGCTPASFAAQLLEESGGVARPHCRRRTQLPAFPGGAQVETAEAQAVAAVLGMDWVYGGMVQFLLEECFWNHRILQDDADVSDILARGSKAEIQPPREGRFFIYRAGKETSPPFVIEVCRDTHTVYAFAPTGNFHVSAMVLDWLGQGLPNQGWARRAAGGPLCFDPRNNELVTWANLRRRDQGLALLDGRHIGVIRHEAAILLAKRWAREAEVGMQPSERVWAGAVQRQLSGMDDPTLLTDIPWVASGVPQPARRREKTIGALLRKYEKPARVTEADGHLPFPPLAPAAAPDSHTFTAAVAGELTPATSGALLADHKVTSHNVGGLGIESSWPSVEGALAGRPAAALFQDCRLKPSQVADLKHKLSRKFPSYQSFVTTSSARRGRKAKGPPYPLAMVTLVLKTDVPARLCTEAELKWKQPRSMDGRLQVVRVEPATGKVWFIVNVYNYTAGSPAGQSEVLDGLKLVCRALMSGGSTFMVMGGDWNATEHPGLRRGYSRTNDSLHRQIQVADAKLQEFLAELRLSGKACSGKFTGDGSTRRSQGRSARLDEVYVLSSEPMTYFLESVWSHLGHDHAAVTASFQVHDPGFRRREEPLRVERLDKKKWNEGILSWQRQVEEQMAGVSEEGDVFEQLQRGVRAAWAAAPKRFMGNFSGERRPRALRHAEARHGLLMRAVEEVREGQVWVGRNWNLRKAIRKGLVSHDTAMLEVPVAVWRLRLAEAQAKTSAELKVQRDKFRKSKLQVFKSKCRARMAAPRSGEIKKLMGKQGAQVQAPVRHSRSSALRHPNGVSFGLPPDEERRWFEALGLPPPSSGVRYAVERGAARWEILKSSSTITVNVSPLTEVHRVIKSLPPQATGRVLLQWERLTLLHPADSRAHEETFFSSNATAAGATCPGCGGGSLTPITRDEGERCIVHVCRGCFSCCEEPTPPPQEDWPFEPQAFEKNVLPPRLAFGGALSWEEFKVLLHTRPPGKAPSDDMMTYEMWQKSPEILQRALFRAMNAALEGEALPDDWLGASIRLLVKKEGYEHLLEFLRPICLMPTKTKMFTSVIAHRLGSAFERHGVFHPAQEGNRQRRNTRRQCLRLLGVVDLSKQKGKTLYVAYLDFRNYFNSLPVDKLLLLLEKLGVSEGEVKMLRQYYQNASFSVKGDDGRKSARIRLRRGVKQGDPLSPLLAAVIAEAFSRRLDLQGLGIPVGEQEGLLLQLSHLFFVDDLALLAWSPEAMQRYLRVVEELCDWLKIEVNMEKTEIAAFDYRRGSEVSTRQLQMYGQPLVRLAPDAAFKYLGIRLTLTGSAGEEKAHVMRATREAALQFKGHPYTPSQVHWLVGSTVVSLFRYSAPFVDWSPEELEALTKEWVVAYRFAHHLPPSTPEIHFRASRERGGLGVLDAVSVLGRECLGVLHQCTALRDDLAVLTGGMARSSLLGLGCTSWGEFGAELRLSVRPTSRLESIFSRLGWAVTTLNSQVDWPAMAVPGEGAGIMSLSHERRLEDASAEGSSWVGLLRSMVGLGIARASEVVVEDRLVLPGALRSVGGAGGTAARELAAVLGKQLEWVAEDGQAYCESPERRTAPGLVAGDRALDLVGGRVLWPLGDGTHAEGVVLSHDGEQDLYEVRLTEGGWEVATLDQLLSYWDTRHRPAPVAWEALKVTLVTAVERIGGHRTVGVQCTQPNPFPHRQVGNAWVQDEVEYECIMNNGYDSRTRSLAAERSFSKGKLLAAHLCSGRRACWFYQSLWPDCHSSKQGWWVVFRDWAVEDGEIRLQYTALDPSTEHRQGSITVEDARVIVQTMGQRAVTSWMSERELGQDPSPEAPYLPRLREYWSTQVLPLPLDASRRVAAHAPLASIDCQEPYWAPRPGKHELDDVAATAMEVEWEYDKMTVQQTPSGRVLMKGSRSSIEPLQEAEAPSSASTLRRAGRRPDRAQTFPLETARVVILESRCDDVVPLWREQWERQVAWEATGGRTLSWAVSEHLRRHGNLQVLLTTRLLTADPAFATPDEQDWQRMGPAVVMLLECEVQHSSAWEALAKMNRWAVVVTGKEVSIPQRTWLRRHGALWEEFDQKDAVVYRKGWWKSGERSLTKTKTKIQVWVSRNLAIPSLRIDGKIPAEAAAWKPPPLPHSADLAAYLAAQPSTRYSGPGHDLVATDGSLRNVGGVRLMGAAAVHGDRKRVAAARVGGACSSTRPELVGIFLAIESTPPDRDLWILVDSSSALSRLSWFKRETFRPPGYRVKDADVVLDIIRLMQGRSGKVRLIKVNGHMGDALHSAADEEAVQVTADTDAPRLYETPEASTAKIVCADGKTRPWPSSVARFWNSQAAEHFWRRQEEHASGMAFRFLSEVGVGRRLLGSALRDVYDWALRDWMRLVNPILLPTLDSKVKWKMAADPNCTLPGCRGGRQTMVHLQLRCLNDMVKNTRQKAHDRVVGVLQRGVDRCVAASVRTAWAPSTAASFWPEIEWGGRLGKLQPDGFVENAEHKVIHILEVARTIDDSASFDGARSAEKQLKYLQLCNAVREARPGFAVHLREFVVGIRGSLPVLRWALHLGALGMPTKLQKQVMTEAIQVTVEGSANVVTAWKKQLKSR